MREGIGEESMGKSSISMFLSVQTITISISPKKKSSFSLAAIFQKIELSVAF